MSAQEKDRHRLYGFILFSVIEETIIAIIAFIILFVLLPSFLILGMVIVTIGLVIFSLVKIYSYWSSTTIPVYDPLINQEGTALTEFIKKGDHWEGTVVVRGERWKARANEMIAPNTRVWVFELKGLTLCVRTTRDDT
ncbi:MAG: NfeD family protein [Candidatus Thorarchaeota archaeon]